MNLWQELKAKKVAAAEAAVKAGKTPGDTALFVLAPMADVTDAAFRRMINKYGKPDVTWTEFVSADGLIRSTPEGKQKLLRDLLYSETERPIVAQLFGSKPEYMYEAAKLCVELGFDGIDINMGCPAEAIERQGSGAAMIKNPRLAREVIRAVKEGAESTGVRNPDGSITPRKIPVSVKTRVGWNTVELETWLPELLAEKPALVTIHARTRKEMSKVPARWEHVKRAVEIRDALKSDALIFGNGDALSIEDARAKVAATGADGVMLGRAIFGNPWLFNTDKTVADISVPEKLRVMVEHTKLFEELLGDIKNFAIMKKHYKAYVTGFDGASELRTKLMDAETAAQVGECVEEFLKNWKG